MSKEFLILRHGEPFMFGLDVFGVTWVSPILFERPIEKLGGGLELFWDGELFDNDKIHITRILAHWKKQLNRRAKNAGVPLASVVDMDPLPKHEREEFLFSVNRGEKTPETTFLRLEDGFKGRFVLRIFGKPKLIELAGFNTREEAAAWHRQLLLKENLDPNKYGFYVYVAPLAFELHGRTDEESQARLAAAHDLFLQRNILSPTG
jgi:hypothetical protein